MVPFGDAAGIRIGGVEIALIAHRTQALGTEIFSAVGIDLAAKRYVGVKSTNHFHAAYAPIASEVVYVAAPGALVPDWSLLPYTKVDKAQWPFVADPHAA